MTKVSGGECVVNEDVNQLLKIAEALTIMAQLIKDKKYVRKSGGLYISTNGATWTMKGDIVFEEVKNVD